MTFRSTAPTAGGSQQEPGPAQAGPGSEASVGGVSAYAMSGAMTRATTAMSLMRMLRLGPDVSFSGSPTASQELEAPHHVLRVEDGVDQEEPVEHAPEGGLPGRVRDASVR